MNEDPTGVAARVAELRRRIATACERAGRRTEEVTLVAAAKGQPAERLRAALGAGVEVFGENRVQEAEAHRAALAGAGAGDGLGWHLIGPLQSNKVKLAAGIFDVIHSIDRPKIAHLLERELAVRGRQVQGFVEVNLGGEASKHGFAPDRLVDDLTPLAGLAHLRIVGLMVIPPPAEAAEGSRPWFRRARELADRLAERPEWPGFPRLLSMGMSDDFDLAIEEGATHVRLGTALFGARQLPP